MSKRRSVAETKRRLSVEDRKWLVDILGEEDDFLSIASDEFASLPGSPNSSSSRTSTGFKKHFALFCDSEEETEEDALRCAEEDMFAFDKITDTKGGDIYSDGEESEDGVGDLDDIYSFDLVRVAQALGQGATQDEIQEIFESEMQKELEQRMAAKASDAATASDKGDLNGLMMPNNVAGLMTPPDEAAPADLDSDVLADRLRNCRRRSSIAQHPKLLEAVGAAKAFHRSSLVQVASRGLSSLPEEASGPLAAKVRQSIAGQCRLRRASLIKAAEVLEVAGVGVHASTCSPDEVSDKLKVVTKALEGARRRYRQSLATAVEAAAANAEAEETGQTEAASSKPSKMPCQGLNQARMNQVIAVAYAKRAGDGHKRKKAAVAPNYAALANMRRCSNGNVYCGPPKRAVCKRAKA